MAAAPARPLHAVVVPLHVLRPDGRRDADPEPAGLPDAGAAPRARPEPPGLPEAGALLPPHPAGLPDAGAARLADAGWLLGCALVALLAALGAVLHPGLGGALRSVADDLTLPPARVLAEWAQIFSLPLDAAALGVSVLALRRRRDARRADEPPA